ncbi:hypothetical protein N7509_007584 [Penicillium cosmopolitanum]|uniref:F-box domain-containing protein n=1 Tax=Penicillium cosmopolitanum TaxID=1131564 RepID=A0A9W9VZ54_9EURO|nr:uncharacterized protein N7509_007584 [Penicillium cosmopolitanum]KAJ5392094.1 hypothetical protein N7509_007584 [Penicillium cosmopolitanum]
MATSTLNILPKELFVLILFQIPDLQTLKSTVLTSRACYAAYQIVRSSLLRGIVMELYSESFSIAEALLALRSKGLRSHQEEVFALLNRWRRRDELKEVPSSPKSCLPSFDEPYTLQETVNLIHLHRQLVFFLDDYSTNMRRPYWIFSPEDWQRCLPIKMLNTEKGRFIRALCRLYTFAISSFLRTSSPLPCYRDWRKRIRGGQGLNLIATALISFGLPSMERCLIGNSMKFYAWVYTFSVDMIKSFVP